MDEGTVLTPAATTMWVFIGILISLLLPVAVRTLRAAKLEAESKRKLGERLAEAWNKYGGNRYLAIAAAATLVAIALVFLLGLEFFKARDAVLAGFAWESLNNKLMGGSGV